MIATMRQLSIWISIDTLILERHGDNVRQLKLGRAWLLFGPILISMAERSNGASREGKGANDIPA